jgi:hypothetical protein
VTNGEYYSGFHQIGARSEGRAEERISGWKAEWLWCGIRQPEISVLNNKK